MMDFSQGRRKPVNVSSEDGTYKVFTSKVSKFLEKWQSRYGTIFLVKDKTYFIITLTNARKKIIGERLLIMAYLSTRG